MDVSAYIDKDLQHSQVLLNNEPDCGYEYFWLNFKDSVNNAHLCSSLPIEVLQPIIDLSKTIPLITKKLNFLQQNRDYTEIFTCINRFLKQYFWLILAEGEYHCSIAGTNLKRWIKVCEIRSVNPVQGFTHHDPLETIECCSSSSMRFISLLHRCCNNRSSSVTIKNYVISVIRGEIDSEELFYELFKKSVTSRSNSIVNKYLEFYPKESVHMFKSIYSIDIPFGIKNSNKILKQIN
jgi:hypothetical protein